MKLLIVDDSNIIRSRIARISFLPALRGMEIVGMAHNGVEALDICRRQQPDVVTMDLTMPEMDGISCVRAMMAFDPRINILVVSALSDKGTAIEALKRGARGFLYKQFTDEQLVAALREVVS